MSRPAEAPPPPDDLAQMLVVKPVAVDHFRSAFTQVENYSLYGGLVAAQALAAAGATVPDGRIPHSVHGYFLRPGSAEVPTDFRVERDRDGGRLSSRRVVALQHSKVIFNLAASFSDDDQGEAFEQHVTAPEVAGPEELPLASMDRYAALEIRSAATPSGDQLPHRFWMRPRHALPADRLTLACALAYLSDLSTGLPIGPEVRAMASIDHALWIHRLPNVGEWLLMDLSGHVRAGGRGLYTGSIFAADGGLVATLAQEMVIRLDRTRTG